MSEIKKIKVQGTTYDIGGGGGGADWGYIGGNINDQTDLKNALDSKGTYSKPSGGIPKTDLASAVQTSLGKADSALQASALNPYRTASAQDVIDATKAAASDVSAIQAKIPSAATSANQLADKAFVNSTVGTNTAYYISNNGQPFTSLAQLEAYSGTVTNNDYAFVVGTDSAGNTTYTRYKYNASTEAWAAEYVLNNSSFTAVQWAAINSGITSGDVALIGTALQPSALNAYRTAAAQDVIDSGKLDANATDVETLLAQDTALIYGDFDTADVIDALYYGKSSVQPDDLADYALKTDLDDKVDIAQGVSHAGEFLVVGDDGNVTTMTLAEWQGGSY